MLHRGRRVGSVFLAEKEGGREFTREDEETLALFASQAAMAIANAQRHREEQRARAGLETLVDTSPVGVVVFDAATGLPRSLNREARRIVDSLRDPEQRLEDLLEGVTFRRADGRVVSLREFPMAGLLSIGETVRAEEIVLRAPDGRSVTVLLNATPIRTGEGIVESVVVTMQDLADVAELERLRAEFLAMVSHELRIPLTSIKGSAATILDSVADLDPAVVRQFVRIMRDQADHMNELVSDLLDVARIETGALPVSPEPAETAALVDRARERLPQRRGPEQPGDRRGPGPAPGVGGPAAHRAGAGQPADQRGPPLAGVVGDPGERRAGGCTRGGIGFRPGAGASPPRVCPACSASSRWPSPGSRGATPAWGWPSARGSWRPTGAASGPRATVWAWAPASPSPCPRWRPP